MFRGQIQTPLGTMLAMTDTQGIYLLEFTDRPELDREVEMICRKTGKGFTKKTCSLNKKMQEELSAYFTNPSYKFTIPMILTGTAFENSVWQILQTIPVGHTSTYSQLAEKLGNPRATRAVGRANGKNLLAILVPCHRLIGANGDLTGYGSGLWRKKWLLDHEGQAVS